MKRNIFFLCAFLAVLFFSCKKDSTPNVSTPNPDFTMLKTGNYWVYEFYHVDTNGTEQKLVNTDSTYILKDTLIGGIQYFVKIQNGYQFHKASWLGAPPDTVILRDSAGYLLQRYSTGQTVKIFARDNFRDILARDTITRLLIRNYQMTGKDSLVNVDAGQFTTRSFRVTCYPLDTAYKWGIRKVYSIYGANTGLVKYTYCLWSEPDHYEARLLRYHVAP